MIFYKEPQPQPQSEPQPSQAYSEVPFLVRNIQDEIQMLPMKDISFEGYHPEDSRISKIQLLIREKISNLSEGLKNRILEEFEGWGPLNPLINDEEVCEIVVNSKDCIWYEKNGKLLSWDDQFSTDLTYHQFIERLCHSAQVHFNLNHPAVQGSWKDFRLHLVSKELTRYQHSICLRRHPKIPWTLDLLASQNWAQEHQIQFLKNMVNEQVNILVIGPTGSGKTSVTNALLQAVSSEERCLILEDTSELHLPNKSSIKLLTRMDPQGHLREVSLSELVRHSLRLRPDRIVVGEIRGEEAKDLLLALSTGHKGSMGTLHAQTAQQALLRLEMLTQLGAPHWSLEAIRTLIFLSLQFILETGKNAQGERELKGIFQLSSRESTGILLDRVQF